MASLPVAQAAAQHRYQTDQVFRAKAHIAARFACVAEGVTPDNEVGSQAALRAAVYALAIADTPAHELPAASLYPEVCGAGPWQPLVIRP